MLSGNKGEWSEIYVFLKLLGEGRLNGADEKLQVIPNVYYPIIKIIREENQQKREYNINSKIKVIDGESNKTLLSLPLQTFIDKSQELFENLKKAKGRSFSFPVIEQFLHSIDVSNLTASKTQKSDIQIVVHDLNTGLTPTLGFSIKSMIGKNSTLFNAGKTTNFIFEIIGNHDSKAINEITIAPKIANRIKNIRENGGQLKFVGVASKSLQLNLQLIDSQLPQILAELLLLKFSRSGTASIFKTLKLLEQNNPLNYDLSRGHPFYEYKLKNFLTDVALGMTPSAIWKGNYNATGGIIIVKEDGDIVCYHIYNRNEFQNYLLHNTRFEQASTRRYNFGELYEESGKLFMNLNLQIRFTS